MNKTKRFNEFSKTGRKTLESPIAMLCQYTEILQTVCNGHLLIKDSSPWILKSLLNFYKFDFFMELFLPFIRLNVPVGEGIGYNVDLSPDKYSNRKYDHAIFVERKKC